MLEYRASGPRVLAFASKFNLPHAKLIRWLKKVLRIYNCVLCHQNMILNFRNAERETDPRPNKIRGAKYAELESGAIAGILAQRAKGLIITK